MKDVEWTGNSRWMPVTIGLVGPAKDMRAIGPTLRLTSPFQVRIQSLSSSLYLSGHPWLLCSTGCGTRLVFAGIAGRCTGSPYPAAVWGWSSLPSGRA